MIAVDTNVLVYAHREEFDLHEAALATLRSIAQGREAWGLPVFCVGEYLRVVTLPGYLDPPSPMTEALANVASLLNSPSVRLLGPTERFWPLLQEAIEDAGARGNLVPDAEIVAVCLEHGADTILTEDKGFRRFSSIRVRTLEGPSR